MEVLKSLLVGGALVGGGLLVFKHRKKLGLGLLPEVHMDAAERTLVRFHTSFEKMNSALADNICKTAHRHFLDMVRLHGEFRSDFRAAGAGGAPSEYDDMAEMMQNGIRTARENFTTWCRIQPAVRGKRPPARRRQRTWR